MLPDLSTIDWIFFDLDATLWDHEGACRDSLEVSAANLGLDPCRLVPLFEEANLRMWAKITSGETDFHWLRRQRWEIILRELGRDDLLPRVDEISAEHIDSYLGRSHVLPGVGEVVPRLAEHCRLAVATNGFHVTQDVKFDYLGGEITRLFEFVFCPDDCGFVKADPAFYEAARERAGNPPAERCLMIGDAWREDVQVPRSLGWKVLWLSLGRPVPDGADGIPRVPSLEALEASLGA